MKHSEIASTDFVGATDMFGDPLNLPANVVAVRLRFEKTAFINHAAYFDPDNQDA
jgi:hypothetical protein